MHINFKSKEELVNSVITGILDKLPDIDLSVGEPLRTLIEVIMAELDLQYWQLEQVYNNSFIDTAYGEDLAKLVRILGINRLPALGSTGRIKFYRETPATQDYTIPAGTLVETLPDINGNIIRFETTENASLLIGTTSVYANIKAVDAGKKTNIISNKIIIINNPPFGIESVINEEPTIGGEEEETDDELRARAVKALETAGQGTVGALLNKILDVSGIKSVKVLDMQRGIGTVDILVLGDVLPMPFSKLEEITKVALDTKAGGIDVLIYEPTVLTQNLNITFTLASGVTLSSIESLVLDAINAYFSNLKIGDSLIKNQLSKEILNKTSGKVIDLIINTPSTNITVSGTSIIVLGTITLN